MRKNFTLLALFILVATSASGQLLYRIQGKDLKQPSYVLGTLHLAPSSFADSIPGFRKTFEQVGQVCGELVMDQLTNQDGLGRLQAAMLMPEGMTIEKMLSKEEYDSLNSFMKDLMGVDLTNPLVGSQLGKMCPSALSTSFSSAMYLKKFPNFVATDGIDTYVQNQAIENGKKIASLETVDEQIFILFKSQSLERQKQMLMCMVKNKELEESLLDALVDAYYSQNLDELERVTDIKLEGGCDSTDEEDNVLIYGRNEKWVKVMPDMMRETPTLFAVGAAHLVGERGVIQLLRKMGYSVEGVK